MCDYSLEMYGSRPAREGEIYVTTRFPSGSIGFASAGDPRTAVCMQCDTKVMLTDIPLVLQTALRVGAEAETIFAQREAGLYRDGLRLADGRFVSLQDLQPGIHAYVPALLERDALEGPREDARGRRLKTTDCLGRHQPWACVSSDFRARRKSTGCFLFPKSHRLGFCWDRAAPLRS